MVPMRSRLLVPGLALVLAVLAATCDRDGGRPLGPAFLLFGKVDTTLIDFGPVAVGTSATRELTITNVGDAPLAGEVAAPCPEFEVIEGRGGYVLAPAESLLVSVRFRPVSAGPKSCRLATGSRCTPVELVGEGMGGGGGGECEVAPFLIDFGLVQIGSTADSTFTLRNLGDSTLAGAIVPASCTGFSLGAGAGSYSLPPGDSLVVQVIFAPEFPGQQGCAILTGLVFCPGVGCIGVGGGGGGPCEIQPAAIDFGPVPLGGSADTTFVLRNVGEGPISGAIAESCTGWSLAAGAGSFSLAPGESLEVRVVFAPDIPGPQSCVIETGLEGCPFVPVAGVGAVSEILDCSRAVPLAFNQPINGNNSGGPTNVSNYACTTYSQWGPEDVYRLVLPGPVTVTVTLDSLEADLDLFLLAQCDRDSCLAASVLGGTSPDDITTVLASGTYYVVVDGYVGNTSPYRLTATQAAASGGGAARRQEERRAK